MSEQLSMVLGTPFERGMEGSALASRYKWTDFDRQCVDAAIEDCARSGADFTTDDVYRRLPSAFPITKGIASRLNVAVRHGVIRNTGRLVKPKRERSNHAQRLAVWCGMVPR